MDFNIGLTRLVVSNYRKSGGLISKAESYQRLTNNQLLDNCNKNKLAILIKFISIATRLCYKDKFSITIDNVKIYLKTLLSQKDISDNQIEELVIDLINIANIENAKMAGIKELFLSPFDQTHTISKTAKYFITDILKLKLKDVTVKSKDIDNMLKNNGNNNLDELIILKKYFQRLDVKGTFVTSIESTILPESDYNDIKSSGPLLSNIVNHVNIVYMNRVNNLIQEMRSLNMPDKVISGSHLDIIKLLKTQIEILSEDEFNILIKEAIHMFSHINEYDLIVNPEKIMRLLEIYYKKYLANNTFKELLISVINVFNSLNKENIVYEAEKVVELLKTVKRHFPEILPALVKDAKQNFSVVTVYGYSRHSKKIKELDKLLI